MPATVELVDATHTLTDRQLSWLLDHIGLALQKLHASGTVSVRVIDDTEMAAAHEEFAGVPGTTDVLTFDLTDPEDQPPPPVPQPASLLSDKSKQAPYPLHADIMICRDEAARQSTARGYPLERELLLYVVHAVLHCMGHDDHEEEASAAMHRMEDAVLESIGVGPVFRVQEQ